MAGVKGRSGRRPMSIEMKRHAVIDKAWDVNGQYLHSNDALRRRAEIATRLVSPTIKQEVEHSGNINIIYGHRSASSSIRQ